jgi:hypothetical protein
MISRLNTDAQRSERAKEMSQILEKPLHVSGVLLLLLLVKLLTINNVADVAGFLDLSINPAFYTSL